jgi:putative redox protein
MRFAVRLRAAAQLRQEESTPMAQQPASTVQIALQEGMHFQAHNEAGMAVSLDASPEHGGKGKGFGPMQLLLISLGSCTGMDVISILRKKRQDVTGYRVEVEGVQSTDYPRVFTAISIRHIVHGNDISEEAVRRAIDLSETKYCPAFAMLQQAAQITSTFVVQAQPPVD